MIFCLVASRLQMLFVLIRITNWLNLNVLKISNTELIVFIFCKAWWLMSLPNKSLIGCILFYTINILNQFHCSSTSSTASLSGNSPKMGPSEWAVPQPSRLKYRQKFNSLDKSMSGYLSGRYILCSRVGENPSLFGFLNLRLKSSFIVTLQN